MVNLIIVYICLCFTIIPAFYYFSLSIQAATFQHVVDLYLYPSSRYFPFYLNTCIQIKPILCMADKTFNQRMLTIKVSLSNIIKHHCFSVFVLRPIITTRLCDFLKIMFIPLNDLQVLIIF